MHTVVVYKVGNADTEHCRFDTGVETCYAFSGNDFLDSLNCRSVCISGFDLGSRRECDKRVTSTVSGRHRA